ncbi:uncharacterized protein CLUP02_03423 [Colletotrichum lupini]|uniref:Uncharacterized protein n=1 Tax=Colletotrichum lupini TaxID=145971 RepID=A0A9Q8SJ98_9PEZI|nr:uncharacterized protein CLUP02_03423 [Colletotrichum lupini]UQC77950.1 hypothetical protein CLUP02_03423 [Colletotrichum lupini]
MPRDVRRMARLHESLPSALVCSGPNPGRDVLQGRRSIDFAARHKQSLVCRGKRFSNRKSARDFPSPRTVQPTISERPKPEIPLYSWRPQPDLDADETQDPDISKHGHSPRFIHADKYRDFASTAGRTPLSLIRETGGNNVCLWPVFPHKTAFFPPTSMLESDEDEPSGK